MRLTEAAEQRIDEIADRDGVSWNEAARRLLKWAVQGERPMPKGWH